MTRKMMLNKSELASMSDSLLSKFCIGLYKDNSLTYKLRFEEKENFKYLLYRGISVILSDKKGNNVLHFAIMLEKIEFITFLVEGQWKSEVMQACEKSIKQLNDAFTHRKAKEISETIRTGQFSWIPDALLSLDKCNFSEGNSALHLAIDIGNK